ncbi:MAG: hypothetical protein BGO95_06070 [Micrococcales bacterium 73-13]|nr:MAG: hypothetical protein BGO95_06070 [Micrococcales bacterium 73-13]
MKSLHLVRSADALALLQAWCAAATAAGDAAGYDVWRVVTGPPVPPEFASQPLSPPIIAIVEIRGGARPPVLDDRAGDGYLVEETVVFDRREPGADPAAEITRVGTQRRAEALDAAGFARHWRVSHGPLVTAHQPGIVRYVQNVVRERLYGRRDADGIHQSTFADEDAYHRRIFDDEHGKAALAADSALLLRDPGQEERVFVVPAEPARDGA